MLATRLLFLAIAPTGAALLAAHPELHKVTVTRASDALPMRLGSLWSEDERAVLVFLRHFG